MAAVGHRPELYRWRRFTQPASRQKPKFDADNVEHWIKRVEQASEFAVSEAFSLKKKSYSRGLPGPVLDLETTEQLHNHDEAYMEAQELLSDWMNSKLKLELASDQEDGPEEPTAHSVPPREPPVGFQKYEKFDDLYDYLEEEMESTTVQDFLQYLLQSEVVDSGILKGLRIEDLKETRKPRDPRIAMELRHKQVKDNRLKRQKEQELLKKERALKKAAMSEAQKQLQEESKKKVLKARREEEEIQKQMVKLRKEVVIKRHFMEEARKMERKRHNLKQMQRLLEVDLPPTVPTHLEYEKEGQRKDKQIRTQELLSKIDIANQKCLQKYFSAWYKLLLDLRVKMGKARALADWKCQLKALRAWRDYTWSQKLEQETKNMENQLRDQNRKKQLAIAFSRKCILHRYFVEWQCWSRTEVEKRELELKKEETKKKMAKLLEEVVHGKCATACSCNAKIISETKEVQDQPVNHKEVAEIPLLQEEQESTTAKIERSNSCSPKTGQQLDLHSLKEPKWAWQVTLKHATLNMEDRAMFGNQTRNSTQRFGNCHQKIAPPFLGAFESRHAFQKQLIEEQRRQLQEQQNLILAFQENERIKRAREDAKQATAATKALDNPIPKKREGKQLRENYSDYKNTEPFRSENHQPATQSRKKVVPSPHPLLKAMEERAIQRAERKKELEEAKKKREEEKLAQMQAEVEERQRQQVAEKEAQLEKRREEKRLQKMKELDKQRRLEREQELLSKAKLHYEKVLLKKRGLEPWRRLLEQSQQNMVVAQRHHCSRLQKGFLLAWLRHIQEILAGKRAQAEELYSSLLLRRSFRIWIQYKDFASTLEDNARKIYETSLKKKVFWAWFDVFNEEKSAFWEKQKMADQYSNRRIMRTTLKAWRRFPVIMKVEREKEGRLEQLRKRVTEILPDFHL